MIDLLKKYVEIEHAAKGDWTGQPFTDPCPQREAAPPPEPSPSMEVVSRPTRLKSVAGKFMSIPHVTSVVLLFEFGLRSFSVIRIASKVVQRIEDALDRCQATNRPFNQWAGWIARIKRPIYAPRPRCLPVHDQEPTMGFIDRPNQLRWLDPSLRQIVVRNTVWPPECSMQIVLRDSNTRPMTW